MCMRLYLCLSFYQSLPIYDLDKTVLFEFEQLKPWQKQNVLYCENDVILW